MLLRKSLASPSLSLSLVIHCTLPPTPIPIYIHRTLRLIAFNSPCCFSVCCPDRGHCNRLVELMPCNEEDPGLSSLSACICLRLFEPSWICLHLPACACVCLRVLAYVCIWHLPTSTCVCTRLSSLLASLLLSDFRLRS